MAEDVPEELSGEQVLARFACNQIRNGTFFEGRLWVTGKRLMYVPKRVSVRRGATPDTISLDEVAKIDVAPRGFNLTDGSLRRRLRVTLVSGQTELFVVWQPQRAAEFIERVRQGIPVEPEWRSR